MINTSIVKPGGICVPAHPHVSSLFGGLDQVRSQVEAFDYATLGGMSPFGYATDRFDATSPVDPPPDPMT